MISTNENTFQNAKPTKTRIVPDHRQMSTLNRRPRSSRRLLAKRESARNGAAPVAPPADGRREQTTNQSTVDIFRLAQNELFGVYVADPTTTTTTRTPPALSGLRRTGTSIDDLARKRQENEANRKIQKDKASKNWIESGESRSPAPSGKQSQRRSGLAPLGFVPAEGHADEHPRDGVRPVARAHPAGHQGKKTLQQALNMANGYDVTQANDVRHHFDNPRYVIPATRGQGRLPHPASVVKEQQKMEQQYQHLQHQFQQQRQQYNHQQQQHREQQQQELQEERQGYSRQQQLDHNAWQQHQQQQPHHHHQQQQQHHGVNPSLPVTIRDLADATAGLQKPRTDPRSLKAKLDVNLLQDLVGGSQPRRRIRKVSYVNYCDKDKTDLIVQWLKKAEDVDPEVDDLDLLSEYGDNAANDGGAY
ncbi:hypothetical protein LSH36_519g03092 [Paralvinella palmiformis]|uniref:Uncharacterized protein n=1 Tax=Paralvinella palmiformis TaxID=53620 RepID=A0AAD9J8F0_9ANNE|nr:hypothetical protein LSH36_519g03092 [Paralvinella palmiformis]